MAIIPQVGRKSLRLRCVIASIYAVLILGSITTVYPFLIMLATSFASKTDYEEYRMIPRYLYDEESLQVKYLEEKHRREHFEIFKLRYQMKEPYEQVIGGQTVERRYGRFDEMKREMRSFDVSSDEFGRKVADWEEFKGTLAERFRDTYFHSQSKPYGEVQVAFQDFLKAKYQTIEALQPAIEELPDEFVIVEPPYDAYERHAWFPGLEKKSAEWAEFRLTLEPRYFNVMTVRPLYQKHLSDVYGKIEEANAKLGTTYRYFWEIPFPRTKPEGAEGPDWEEFVRKKAPLRYARLDGQRCRASYIDYIKEKYQTVAKYNAMSGDDASSFETATLYETLPPLEKSLAVLAWQDYYEKAAPVEYISIDSADERYEEFLGRKYGDVQGVNAAYGTQYASLPEAEPPWREQDHADLMERKSEILWNFFGRNYVFVFKRVFLQGRPIFNTFILVTLTVLSQVTINPLAAYALSRYRLTYASKVLIFMLATMAFPAEVTMIPNFLMIKNLGMLNTFGALLLPRLANGYYVFLLKGFFDSLPQELYEAASIDGASEFKMFYTITLPLSLPVLSVIALFAFGMSYGSFLWAFTTCQDKSMWTLMVFLHQFQQQSTSAPFVTMAALVLAAIPTMVVFLSAQKVLMRGIVVPTMK